MWWEPGGIGNALSDLAQRLHLDAGPKIIITSRNYEWGRGVRALEVDVFDRVESASF